MLKFQTFLASLFVFMCGFGVHAEEPNDSISTATPSSLNAGDTGAVTLMGNNGDGEHAPSGDIDFYSLSANTGQVIRVDVQARSIGRVMDSVVGLYSSDGTLIASNDDDGQSQDSFINIEAPANDDYYVAVSSWVAGDAPANLPTDPFAAGTGPGVPAGGIDDYEIVIGLDVPVIISRSGGAFPVVPVSENATATLTLLNDGKQDLVISNIFFEGDNASRFSIQNTLPLAPVPSGQSVGIQMTYSPNGLNGRFTSTLVVESNDTITPTQEVSVSGAAYRTGGLIARFPLDEPVGTSIGTFGDVVDLTGNDFRSRFFTNGGASITFARPGLLPDGGTSVRFTGNPNSYIQVGNLVHLPTMSISLWFRAEADGALFNRDPKFGNGDRFYGLDIAGGALRWRVNGETLIETDPEAIQFGEVYHAVVTHLDEDGFGNDTATRSRLVLNGEVIGKVDAPVGYDSYENVADFNNTRLWIATKSGGTGFGGEIDDFQVYDVELTVDEAKALFNNPGTAARVEDPNLAVPTRGVFGTLPSKPGVQMQNLAMTNTGESQTLTISSAMLAGPDSGRFSIAEVPTELAPGETKFLEVTFDPAGADGTFDARLEFVTNDEGGASVVVDLTTRVEKESGLLTHFKMDESEGSIMSDSSGNRFHGVYKAANGGSFALGQPGLAGGTAVRLDDAGGAGAAFGELEQDAGLPSLDSLSISLWLKLDPAEADGGTAVLFSKGDVVGDPFSAVMAVTAEQNPFQWFASGAEALTTSAVIETDKVHHVVVSHRDDNGTGEGAVSTTIYVDNVMAGEVSPSSGFDDSRPSILQIGAFIGTLGLNGVIDDFQLYSKAIEAEDVDFLFNNPGMALGGGEPMGMVDSDGDGLPDDYETDVFGDLSQDGNGDFDGDGQSNEAEFVAGTDPTDAGDLFEILTLEKSGDETVATFPFVEGRTYELRSSPDLETFTIVADAVFNSEAGIGSFTWSESAREFYYQVAVSESEVVVP